MSDRETGGWLGRWVGGGMWLLGCVGCAAQGADPSSADPTRAAEAPLEAPGREAAGQGARVSLVQPSASLRAATVRAQQQGGAREARFHVREEGGRLVARSPERGVTGRFSPDGFEVESDDGTAQGTLRTSGLRCDETRVEPARTGFERGAAPNRVERRLAGGALSVTEWVESGPLGLEQGYDVTAPGCDALAVELAVEGLTPEFVGDEVRLVGDEGALRYAQLFALDAEGRSLPARFDVASGRVELRVDTREARWPVMVDPLVYTERQIVTPGTSASVGLAVSVDGDLALVGAPVEGGAGAAYVFARSGGTWTLEATLVSSDVSAGDVFGVSVSLSGETALIGARNDDDSGNGSGSAYVFVRSGTSWSQQAKLVAADAAEDDNFGVAVSVSGDTALIGAYQDSDDGFRSGSAYVFVRSGTSWSQQAKLTAADAAARDSFGVSVSVSGDAALVGAWTDDTVRGSSSGSAYVFVRSGTSWSQQAKLLPDDGMAEDRFGFAVSSTEDTAVVGAYLDDDAGADSGSAYVFARSGTNWSQQAKLSPGDGAAEDLFGISVAIDGDTVIVGASGDDDSGSAYVFVRDGTSWSQDNKITASDGGSAADFGRAVALSMEATLLGAPGAARAYFGTLRPPAPDGEACSVGADCISGFCVDGVCCDTACGAGVSSDCQACAVAAGAATDGVCGPSTGNSCDDGSLCTSSDMCDAGTCGGPSPCDASTSCTEGGGSFACSACPAGTSSADGTGASACDPCAAGSWSEAGATSCTAWSDCPPGEGVLAAGTAASDRTCAACEAGTFSATSDADACAAWSDCVPGEREASAGTSSTDRVCEACAAGSFSASTNASSCAPWSECGATRYETGAPTSTSDRQCTALTVCDRNQYETVAATSTSDRSCATLTSCTSTEYQSTAPTPTSDRVCSPLTVCTDAEYQSRTPTSTRDRGCSPLTECEDTEYESSAPTDRSDRECSPLTECQAGEYESSAPSATADRACSMCSTCGPTEREVAPCAATSDTVCAPIDDAGVPPDGGGVVVDSGAADAAPPADGAVTADAGVDPVDGGCSCRAGAPARPKTPFGMLVLGLGGAGLILRRRR